MRITSRATHASDRQIPPKTDCDRRALTPRGPGHTIQVRSYLLLRRPVSMISDQGGGSITSVLHETRTFPPPADFAKKAHIGSLAEYEALWNRAKDDPQGFWGDQAKALDWSTPWSKVLDWKPPFAKWFVGGKLNAS